MTMVQEAVAALTPRQLEILDLRLRGKGRRQIAHLLGISPRTVCFHINEARAATGTTDELELLLYVDRQWRTSA